MDILPIDQAVITIVYNKTYYNIIHQIANVLGKTEHNNYNNALASLMAYDVYFTITFPYEIETLAKEGHLIIIIQNPGLSNTPLDYLIIYPDEVTEEQIAFLISQEQALKQAREINFERYNKQENAFYTFQTKRDNDYQKYKEYLEVIRTEKRTRQRKIELE